MLRLIEPLVREKAEIEKISDERIGRNVMRKKLDRNDTLELRIFGFVDAAHAALAELRENFVVEYGFAEHF